MKCKECIYCVFNCDERPRSHSCHGLPPVLYNKQIGFVEYPVKEWAYPKITGEDTACSLFKPKEISKDNC